MRPHFFGGGGGFGSFAFPIPISHHQISSPKGPKSCAFSTTFFLLSAMAESGVTAEGLKTKLVDVLQAIHVEIEDMSGTIPFPNINLPHHPEEPL